MKAEGIVARIRAIEKYEMSAGSNEVMLFINSLIDEANQITGHPWKRFKTEAVLAAFSEEELAERYFRWQIEKEET